MVRSASSRVSNHEAREFEEIGNALSPTLSRPQRSRETFELAVAWRQAEAEEIVGPVKTAAPDVLCGERSVDLTGVSAAREPE
jgi:hypothetical protein